MKSIGPVPLLMLSAIFLAGCTENNPVSPGARASESAGVVETADGVRTLEGEVGVLA